MLDSVHLARWIEGVPREVTVHVVASGPHRKVHPTLLSLAGQGRLTIQRVAVFANIIRWVVDRFVFRRAKFRGRLLKQELGSFNPDLIHLFETQSAGYMYIEAEKGDHYYNAKVALTLFGSDFVWFRESPKHAKSIKQLLSKTSLLHYECERDEAFARENGFEGISFGPLPASGTLPNPTEETQKTNQLVVKGYSWPHGMFPTTLLGIVRARSSLGGWKIQVISCDFLSMALCLAARIAFRLDIRAHAKFKLAHSEVQRILEESRIYIALSRSDGLPATFVEAMGAGVYCIQSSTGCVEAFLDGFNLGKSVETNSADSVSKAIPIAVNKSLNHVAQTTIRQRMAKVVKKNFRGNQLELYRSLGFAK